LSIREKYDNKLNMIEKEIANVQKCLQYDTSLVPEREEHSRLKRPTVAQPIRSKVQNTSTDTIPVPERVKHSKLKRPTVAQPTGSRVQNTSTDTSPVPERKEHSKLKKPRGQNTSTDQTRRILQDAKSELGQILQSQVCERSPREQRMTEAAFLTIGSRSRTRERSFSKSKNQLTGNRSISTDHTGSRSSSTDQTGCGDQNPSTDHMRRLLQNAKLDLVQMLQRSTSAP
jgi:hypothetical protein